MSLLRNCCVLWLQSHHWYRRCILHLCSSSVIASAYDIGKFCDGVGILTLHPHEPPGDGISVEKTSLQWTYCPLKGILLLPICRPYRARKDVKAESSTLSHHELVTYLRYVALTELLCTLASKPSLVSTLYTSPVLFFGHCVCI